MALVVSVALAVAGWLVNQWLARRAIRRTTTIEFLLSAYRRLESASNRSLDDTSVLDLESAFADVQLLGSAEQIRMANEAAVQFAQNRSASFDRLLADLRQSLRRELLLEDDQTRPKFLRITNGREHG